MSKPFLAEDLKKLNPRQLDIYKKAREALDCIDEGDTINYQPLKVRDIRGLVETIEELLKYVQ
jgi:hypothetical protein